MYNFAPGPVQKVIEQAVSFVLAEELITSQQSTLAFDINFVLYVAAGLEIQYHELSRFIRSRDPVSYNLWLHLTIVYLC